MSKQYKTSLFIFRRDLRLHDNSALIAALRNSNDVIPCFIFDKRQVENNEYCSDAGLKFMAATLYELEDELARKNGKLYFFYGIAEEIIDNILASKQVDAVYLNRDYTPFSRKRDQKIMANCHKHGVAFHGYADVLLHEPEECLKANREPYTVFTHFYKRAAMLSVNAPVRNQFSNYYRGQLLGTDQHKLQKLLKIHHPNLLVKGGRREALKLLSQISSIKDYQYSRNFPAENDTTHLSAHHKFGTISIRETYTAIINAFGAHHTLVNELYWRDFFTHIGWHFPHVFGGAFHKKFNAISWRHNNDHLRAWCQGMTGFPIVDAGMRELNATGYMHNRVRMITASFLTKDLQIDWRLGEKYFAQQLVDYDPAVNNGNWQWSASTGCDAQPYFRIFNPWLQQKKFDPECLYIKRWVPELARCTAKEIHQLSDKPPACLTNYPTPIVDHRIASEKAKQMFKAL